MTRRSRPPGGDREHGGHKGFCLAALVDILSGVFGGANRGPFAPPFALRQEVPGRSVGRGIGHFVGALRVDGFIDPDEFGRRVDEWVRVFRAARPAPGTPGVVIPGDPERRAEAERLVAGVPPAPAVVAGLRDIAPPPSSATASSPTAPPRRSAMSRLPALSVCIRRRRG